MQIIEISDTKKAKNITVKLTAEERE